jgi:enamine deaminase RidA (YjgF/YER057c/UK114 family)
MTKGKSGSDTDLRPAAMMISAGLADPRMKIEIEVTALRQLA